MNKLCKFCGGKLISYLNGKNWRIKVCVVCGIGETHPEPKKSDYDEDDFYKQFGYSGLTDLPYLWKGAIYSQCNLIKSKLKRGSKILEIGCGRGFVLKELNKMGFNVFGIEPSKSASEYAKKSGIKVSCGYFPSKEMKDKYDLIFVSQVFEHIKDSKLFLKEIKEHLNSGGYVLFVQTNYQGIIPKREKSKWYAWVPEQHYWHFSVSGLKKYLCGNGFTFEKVGYSSIVHPIGIRLILSLIVPSYGDQFHLLVKKTK